MSNILAIDIGGSKFEIGLVTKQGQIRHFSHFNLPVDFKFDKSYLKKAIKSEVDTMRKELGAFDIDSVGVAVPGPCDPKNGIFFSNVNNSKISNWYIKDDFEKLFNLPVSIENDANACAVAEKHFGNCKNVSDFLWITLSTGCGGGLFLKNKLYRGTHFLAGEVGHIQINYDDPKRCECGIYGDMEAEGSGNAMGRKYLEMTGAQPDPSFKSKQVSELARGGDKIAIGLFYQSGVYLARLCAIASSLLNLQKVVIGGGVSVYDFDLLEPGIIETLPSQLFRTKSEDFPVVKTNLGYHAALLGAAAITLTDEG